MRIKEVKAIPVWYEVTDAYRALFGAGKKEGTMVHAREGWFTAKQQKENVFVRITTDDGVVGWGEATAHPVTSETQAGQVAAIELFGKTIMDMDPFNIAGIHAKLDHLFLHANTGARAAIDIACYDIMGKASGQPIYNLLGGGFQTRFGRLATMPRQSPKEMGEAAAALIEQGYTCFEPKMTGHLESLDADADRIEAILTKIPRNALVIADPNQTWGTAKDTIELLTRRFKDVPNLAIEQPVLHHDKKGLQQITNTLPHKVVADEAIDSIQDATEIAYERMADMISLKIGKCGGLYKSVQMMRIAESAGLSVRVDWTQGSRLLDTATAHLHAAIRLVGCDPGMDYHLRIADNPVAEGGAVVENGQVVVPDRPGLGLVVDEQCIAHLNQRH